MRPTAASAFTYIELMVALTVGLLIMAVAYQMLLQAAQLSSINEVRTELNAQAREVTELIMDGGIVDLAPKNTIDENDVFEGLHGAANIDSPLFSSDIDLEPSSLGMTINRDGQRLQITDGGDAVKSAEKNVTIDCPAGGVPHPDCSAGSKALNGFLASDASISIEIETPSVRCGGDLLGGGGLISNDAAAVGYSMTLLEPRALFRFEEFDGADYRFEIEGSVGLHLDCRA